MNSLSRPLAGICMLLAFTACNTKTSHVDSCGDGFVDPGEECDSGVGDQTCGNLGFYNPIGTLTCTSTCQLDVSDCGGRCGDGEVNADEGEDCDGINLSGNSCQSLGFGGGTLACLPDCSFDVTGCASICGNGFLEGDEACDDGQSADGDGCSAACAIEDGWECTPGHSVAGKRRGFPSE